MQNLIRKDLKRLKTKYNALERSRDYFQRRCEILETIIANGARHIVVPSGSVQQERYFEHYCRLLSGQTREVTSVASFSEVIIQEIDHNSRLSPFGRRWSLCVLMFCFLVRMLGSKCYDYLRLMVPLPCKTTLMRHFAPSLSIWRTVLLDFTKVSQICSLFRKKWQTADDVEVVLGIDAMAMEPVTEAVAGADVGCNNVFLFRVMPLRCQYESFCAQLMTRDKGNAGPDVVARFKMLQECLKQEHVMVKYVAVDGDSGYKSLHDETFEKWWKEYQKVGLGKLLDSLDENVCFMVADMLHLLKNSRARLLGNSLTLHLDGSFSFNSQKLNEILELGLPLVDKSSHGKMRDQYALCIFNFDNFLKLVVHEEWEMAFFILPYAMWIATVTYSGFSVQTRIDLLIFVFETFVYHMKNISQIDKSVVSQNKTSSHVQYFCSRIQCIRTLNTLLAQLRELMRHPENLALGRIGTHGLECVFGTVRLLCHNKHSWQKICSAFSRLMCFKDLTRIFGVIGIRGRLNSAGVKVIATGDEDLVYVEAPQTGYERLFECTQMKIMENTSTLDDDLKTIAEEMSIELMGFLQYIEALTEALENQSMERDFGPPNRWIEGVVSHHGIVPRLIMFNRPREAEDSGPIEGREDGEEVLIQKEDSQFLEQHMPSIQI